MELNQLITQSLGKKSHIAVLGDVMIDEYYEVHVPRLSPEVPIQVLLSLSTQPHVTRMGGALNVAYQFRHLNTDVELYSFSDHSISELLIGYTHIESACDLPANQIPIKRRYYSGSHALTRWDIEADNYGMDTEEILYFRECIKHQFLKDLEKFKFDAVILSDYSKGFFDEDLCKTVIDACNKLGIITVVDPKDSPISWWNGCTYFKPNKKELLSYVRSQEHIDNSSNLITLLPNFDCSAVIVTAGNESPTIYSKWNKHNVESKVNVESKSYIGAGDCFLTYFTKVVSASQSNQYQAVDEAVNVSYLAAAEYVQDRYNKAVSPLNLIKSKYIEDPTLFKYRDFKLAFSNGCFDLFHSGHLSTLEFAKKEIGPKGKLCVGVNTDAGVKRLKCESRPIISLAERIRLLSALECVDYVVSFDEDSPSTVIQAMGGVDLLVKGGDYEIENIKSRKFAVETKVAPKVDCLSTSQIIDKIRSPA